MRFIVMAMLCLLLATTSWAAKVDEQPKVQFMNAGTVAGLMHGQAGVWGTMRAQVRNRTDRAVHANYAVHFNDMPTVQFVMPLWVPPQSDRYLFVPVRPPTSNFAEKYAPDSVLARSLQGKSLLLDTKAEFENRLDDGIVMILKDRARLRNEPVTAMISGRSESDDARQIVPAMRDGSGLRPRTYYLREGVMPFLTVGWQGLDALVISKSHPDLDAAELESMRQWIISGGRLWVMIDQVEPAFMTALLREIWTVSIVDYVGLTQVCLQGSEEHDHSAWLAIDHTIKVDRNGKTYLDSDRLQKDDQHRAKQLSVALKRDKGLARHVLLSHADVVPFVTLKKLTDQIAMAGGKIIARQRSYDKPVKLARVFAPGWEILHEVNGWPASLRRRYGSGWVLITTLGPRAWMRPREEPKLQEIRDVAHIQGQIEQRAKDIAEKQLGDPFVADSSYRPRPALQSLSRWFNQRRVETLLPADDIRKLASNQLGFKIMSRNLIMMVLGLFVLILIGSGLFLYRRQRLEYVGVIGMACAIVLSGGLVILGSSHREQLPVTLANIHVVRLSSDEPYAVISGVVGIYAPEEDKGPLTAMSGGVVWPDREGQEYEQLRMVWTDFSQWTWENLRLPSGAVRLSELEHVVRLEEPVSATLSFGSEHMVCTIDLGPFTNLEDMISVAPEGRFSPEMSRVGAFVVSEEDVLRRGDYLRGTGGLLNDVQQRRQDVYKTVIEGRYHNDKLIGNITEPKQAMLMAWSSTLDMGFRLPQEFERRDATLLSIPLQIVRPKVGQRIHVPAEFITFARAAGGINQLYDPRKRTWLSPPAGGMGKIRFQLPPEVWPLEVEKATLTVDLRAPDRVLQILVPDRSAPIFEVSDPMGPIGVELGKSVIEAFDGHGGLVVSIRVSSVGGVGTTTTSMKQWEMNGVSIEVGGVVIARQR